MLEYGRIDISEGIDIKKCKETSREFMQILLLFK